MSVCKDCGVEHPWGNDRELAQLIESIGLIRRHPTSSEAVSRVGTAKDNSEIILIIPPDYQLETMLDLVDTPEVWPLKAVRYPATLSMPQWQLFEKSARC